MGRLLDRMAGRVGAERMDRIWVFPPLVRERREWGLVAMSCRTEDPEVRELITGRYLAELTGQGIVFESEVATEGRAPPDRLPRIMDGVVRRSKLELEVPREAEVGGDPERLQALLLEYRHEDGSESE